MSFLAALFVVLWSGPKPAGPPPFVVALDAGHGGTNLGAAGAEPGLYEKRLTLDVARRIRRRLSGNARIRVVMCRDDDVLVPVRARVRCANGAGARLFVSLHANASPAGDKRGTQQGFELYVLPVEAVDQEAALAAARAGDDTEAAWQVSLVRSTARESLAAARRMQLELGDALGAVDRGIKQAGAMLDVLQGLTMPAVLVEIGFVDHPEEGARLGTAEYREQIAAALGKAIADLAWRERRAQTDSNITAGRER